MCECDGLCKLEREELLAVLSVRLKKLSLDELSTFNQFLQKLREAKQQVTLNAPVPQFDLKPKADCSDCWGKGIIHNLQQKPPTICACVKL